MKKSPVINWSIVVGLILLFSGTAVAGYQVSRSSFYELMLWLGLAFVGYGILIKHRSLLQVTHLIVLATIVRLLLLLATPELSDDVYRFVWDGRILANGGNPYLHLPSELTPEERESFNLDMGIYDELNSPDYYTVYPPLNQLMFTAATLPADGKFPTELLLLKLIVIFAEVMVLLLMVKILKWMKKPPDLAAVYAFNPLVIIELSGNLHFEGVELALLLFSLLLCLRRKTWLAGILFGCAVSVKLLPLLFLPFVFYAMGWSRGFKFSAAAAGSFTLLFIPFISAELFANVWSSLDLYFQRFEFNASFYFLIREMGEWIKGYNIIQTAGPVMALSVGVILLLFAFQNRILKDKLLERLLFALLIYYLFATIVHPWYVVLLVALSVFTKWRFPIWWSASILLSYAFYHNNQFEIAPIWLWIEYAVLFIALFWEGFAQKKFFVSKEKGLGIKFTSL